MFYLGGWSGILLGKLDRVRNKNNLPVSRLKVNILASHGERPCGSSILAAKNTARVNYDTAAQSGFNDVLRIGNVIDGLDLEEKGDGRVCVVTNGSGAVLGTAAQRGRLRALG